jgi:hypothetical protein
VLRVLGETLCGTSDQVRSLLATLTERPELLKEHAIKRVSRVAFIHLIKDQEFSACVDRVVWECLPPMLRCKLAHLAEEQAAQTAHKCDTRIRTRQLLSKWRDTLLQEVSFLFLFI